MVALAIMGVMLVFLSIFPAINTGMGWSALNSADSCIGMTRDFVHTVTIFETVYLGLYLGTAVFLFLALCAYIHDDEPIWTPAALIAVVGLVVVKGIVNTAFFIWGIVALANHSCEGTFYFTAAIVFVVMTGLGVVSGLFAGKRLKLNEN